MLNAPEELWLQKGDNKCSTQKIISELSFV